MKLKQNFYKLEIKGTLKNGLTISATFEVKFNKEIEIGSEEYKTTEKEIRDIISLVQSNY